MAMLTTRLEPRSHRGRGSVCRAEYRHRSGKTGGASAVAALLAAVAAFSDDDASPMASGSPPSGPRQAWAEPWETGAEAAIAAAYAVQAQAAAAQADARPRRREAHTVAPLRP
eukprot:6476731-Prymnesium_polylepis.1